MQINNILNGNSLDVLKNYEDNFFDAIITDPPYGLSFMGKKWDYDVPDVKIWKECLRVLKPGGYLLAFAGTRTQHRMACRIEDAGFEIRDMIAWVYGCLSEDTEILTKDGWKDYNKITCNNLIYCYNVDKDIFEYHLPTNYFLYENKHTSYRIHSDNTDQIVSRNHRVAVEQDGRIIFKYAETLKQQENIPILESMPEMGEAIGNIYKGTSYKEKILLGLCMKSYIREKEMNIEGYKLYVGEDMGGMLKAIYDEEKETLKILLLQMQWDSKMTEVSEACTQVKELMDRTIKKIIQSEDVMTELQVLEELRNSYQKEMKVCTSNDKICEMSCGISRDEQKRLICNGTQIKGCNRDVKITYESGMYTSCQSQCYGQQDGEFDVIQNKLRTQELGTLKKYTTTLATITEIEYDGYVWCVEVPTGCFVARRNGKVFLTGNSGFPKSLNIGKAIDKLLGNEREVIGIKKGQGNIPNDRGTWGLKPNECVVVDKGTSEREGRGTSLKPALEPVTVARKPLSEKTVAENVLKWGTGGINIDNSRVGTEVLNNKGMSSLGTMHDDNWISDKEVESTVTGRFPANLIHDGSDEVVELFPSPHSAGNKKKSNITAGKSIFGIGGIGARNPDTYADSGSASRFFYCAKASKSERNRGCDDLEEKISPKAGSGLLNENGKEKFSDSKIKNNHPTVKPIKLMEYLVKLVTKENTVVLDPFAGSGSTLIACKNLNRNYVGIELDEDYVTICKARLGI